MEISEIGMRAKLEDEVKRYGRFAKLMQGGSEMAGEGIETMDIRTYAKYLLKEGSISEKRELLGIISRDLRQNKTVVKKGF
ncbi:MAG: hypothetical protein HQ488_05285 [Parcubacteria group bacterium]|nr:hypothetical protein [Parcubacteria group bacterium]